VKHTLTLTVLLLALLAALRATDVDALDLVSGGEPRAFFFRQPEMYGQGGKLSFERWDKAFLRLNGIMGKVLDEELAGRQARNPEWFDRFKREHPQQALLLHFNGDARDPCWECSEFFAGHWLYFAGCRVTDAVPAQGGETTIAVENPGLFHLNMGLFINKNDELGICALGPDGKPDWKQSEQLDLLAIDVKTRTLRVRRGAFGTTPRAFAAGKTYIAAHVTEGPWIPTANLLWLYNFSTACPRDARGHNCSDVLVEDIGHRFQTGGALERFDGLEFDVLFFQPQGAGRRRQPDVDCDGDGKPDSGFINGINTYGIGVYEFCRKLRERLGENKLIMADGQTLADFSRPEDYQRSFGLLNGIESEGFPGNFDWQMADWSGGLNRFNFWRQNARAPVLNYINYKYIVPRKSARETMTMPTVPLRTTRLAMAAGLITDAAFAYCLSPPKAPGEVVGVYDELRMGTAHHINWLGKPLAPPVRLGLHAPDLLGGAFADRLRADQAMVERAAHEHTVKVSAVTAGATNLCLTLPNLQVPEGDLLVNVRVKADPMHGYPAEIARIAWLEWKSSGPPLPKERIEFTPTRVMTWANPRWFEAQFYFRNLGPAAVDLTLHFEGGEPVYLADLTAHAAADTIIRDYERGAVLANPSLQPYTFDLAKLFPHIKLRRLQGSPEQDSQTNNGLPLGATVTVGPRDALFLVKDTTPGHQ